jgi:hypothetical protein
VVRADRKGRQTVRSYTEGVEQDLAWCLGRAGRPLDRSSVRGSVSTILTPPAPDNVMSEFD